MGVQGLWSILEPTAEPVTLESLEGKRFAIDVSLWLYQALYGYGTYQQEVRCPHLSLLLNRLSKLLFYKIRPVFVFDGPNVPLFKRKILRERQMKRYMEEITMTKAQKRALTEMVLSQDVDGEHSRDKWKSAFGLTSRKTEDEKMFEMADLPSSSGCGTHLKRERNDSDEPEVLYSSVVASPSTKPDESIMTNLISRDERLDYLLSVRERERAMRLTEDQVPEDSRDFCNFQIERLLKRNRINEQLDMLKKEALGQVVLSENKPKDSGGGSVLLTVMEGITRGHFITRDNDDVMIDEESTTKEQKIRDSISWPVIVEQMKNEQEPKVKMPCNTTSFKDVPRKGEVMKCKENSVDSDDDENEALQEAIAMSLRETTSHSAMNQINYSFGCESKGDVIEKLRNAFASRNRDLQRDTWSESEKCSSDSDEFIDVDEPRGAFTESSPHSTFNSASIDPVVSTHENEKDWMPNYVNELDDKKKMEPESRIAQAETELQHEQETVYKECQELLRLCGVPFVVSPGEAEAQCCELERLGLVQGIVSDDSDVWLFGASTVYKNMFNLKRRVQMYSSKAIHEQLGLTRWEAIEIALLSGGDYTPGLENVGVVTALELISEFAVPLMDDSDKEIEAFALLQRISDWLNDRQESIKNEEEQTKGKTNDPIPSTNIKSKRRSGDKRFETARRLKLKATVKRNNENEVIEAFPSREVFEAYSRPLVDSSTEKPIWSMVNEKELEIFVWQRLGWDRDRLKKQTKGSLQRWNEYIGDKRLAYQTHITSFTHTLHKSPDDQRMAPTTRVMRALRRLAVAKKEHPDPSVSLIWKTNFADEPSDSSNLSMSFEATDPSTQEPIFADETSCSSRESSTVNPCRAMKRPIKDEENEVNKKADTIDNLETNAQSTEMIATRTKARPPAKKIKRRAPSKRLRGAKDAQNTAEGYRKGNNELNLSEESSD